LTSIQVLRRTCRNRKENGKEVKRPSLYKYFVRVFPGPDFRLADFCLLPESVEDLSKLFFGNEAVIVLVKVVKGLLDGGNLKLGE
jgi:hypothetical protein